MWFDILKSQELTTSQMGATMDWENEAIPDKEDDECRKIIMGMMDRAKRYEDLWHAFIHVETSLTGTISEESACRALEEFKKIDKTDDNTSIDIPMDKGYILLDNTYVSSFVIIESLGRSHFKIAVVLKTDVRRDKELLEDEYQKVCEYIFGEYYNTDFKIE